MVRYALPLLLTGLAFAAPIAARGQPARDGPVQLIVHSSRSQSMSKSEARAVFLKQKRFWDDGKPIVPINREAGTTARESFSKRLFGQTSRKLAEYWNQRYFEAGEFPPATLASEEAVRRYVTENPEAIGYVIGAEIGPTIAVVLTLD